MPLKIICVEEHVNDPGMHTATQSAMARVAPYRVGLGSRFLDDPTADPNGLPKSEALSRAASIADAPVEDRLGEMTAYGIDIQVLSYTQSIQYADIDAAVELTRAANDRLAQSIARNRNRFAGFAVLPWQSVNEAVRELDRCVTQLGFVGAMLVGTPGEDAFLDDPRYAPVLSKLEHLQVPVYLHPGPPMLNAQKVYFNGFHPEVTARFSTFGWGFHHEAGLQVLRLILSGIFDRYRKLRIISGHWGEMVPFNLHRLDETLPPAATGLERTISQAYRDQVYVTPSGILSEPHFRFIYEVIGAGRILFSTDYPYLTLTGARAWLESLAISEVDRQAIAHGNAEQLLRLL